MSKRAAKVGELEAKTAKRGPGRPRAGERDQRTDAILDAAAAVFLEQGFARARTDEMAKRAGASKGTFYARYPSKAELFAAVMRRRSERLTDFTSAAGFAGHSPIEKTLYQFGVQVLAANLGEEGQGLQRLLLAETARFPELAQAFWQNGPGYGREQVKLCLERAREEKLVAMADAGQAADQFMSLVFGWVMLRAGFHLPPLFEGERGLRKWVREAVKMFLRAYRPAARVDSN